MAHPHERDDLSPVEVELHYVVQASQPQHASFVDGGGAHHTVESFG